MREMKRDRDRIKRQIDTEQMIIKHTSLTLFLSDNMCSDGAGVRFYFERRCIFFKIFFKRQKNYFLFLIIKDAVTITFLS